MTNQPIPQTMELKELTNSQLTQFCKENPNTQVAAICQDEEGYNEMQQRIHTLLENDFAHQSITVEEVCWWIENNDFSISE